MNTAWAFFFMGIGVGLVAVHNYIRRGAEYRARRSGYHQGKKEMRLFYEGWAAHVGVTLPEPEDAEVAPPEEKERKPIKVDESFMEKLYKYGKASTKFPKAK